MYSMAASTQDTSDQQILAKNQSLNSQVHQLYSKVSTYKAPCLEPHLPIPLIERYNSDWLHFHRFLVQCHSLFIAHPKFYSSDSARVTLATTPLAERNSLNYEVLDWELLAIQRAFGE
uniref:Uncharacterized protein n=1 Tax=Crocodylus porosus TaxID=8502 RepID=A0A7M4FVN8_CROPO